MVNIASNYRNAHQNYNKVSPPTSQKGHCLSINNVGEYVETREGSCIAGGNINWGNRYGKQYGSFLKTKKQNYRVIQ